MARGKSYSTIADVETIRQMDATELKRLSDSLETAEEREELADNLLRIHSAWRSNAHSEQSDTRRRRKIRREVFAVPALESLEAKVDADIMQRAIDRAYEAALTPLQQSVWYWSDIMGWKQQRIAGELHIKQPEVSRLLNRARTALWAHIDKNSTEYRVFVRETRRAAYHRPPHRPRLPIVLDEARRLIELDCKTSTHIQIDQPRKVEIWENDEPVILIDEEQRQSNYALSFRQTVARAKKIKKLQQSM